jgi:hypothetical protein
VELVYRLPNTQQVLVAGNPWACEFPNCHPHLGVEGFGTKEGAYEQINALNTRFKEADSASQSRPIDLLLSDTFSFSILVWNGESGF